MKCQECSAETYKSRGGDEICPSCGYGASRAHRIAMAKATVPSSSNHDGCSNIDKSSTHEEKPLTYLEHERVVDPRLKESFDRGSALEYGKTGTLFQQAVMKAEQILRDSGYMVEADALARLVDPEQEGKIVFHRGTEQWGFSGHASVKEGGRIHIADNSRNLVKSIVHQALAYNAGRFGRSSTTVDQLTEHVMEIERKISQEQPLDFDRPLPRPSRDYLSLLDALPRISKPIHSNYKKKK